MNDETPLGTFEEQVMLAVVRTTGDAYGMVIRREIEEVTGREIAVGAVYATLDRLEAKKLVASRRGDVDGMSRRLFTVLPAGARALAESKAMRERLWRGVDLRGLLGARRGRANQRIALSLRPSPAVNSMLRRCPSDVA
jgi:PadR family transcriptional regulator PadR